MDSAVDNDLWISPRLEDDSGGTDQLGNNDPFRSVDDESPLVCHHGEITHENRLLFDLSGSRIHKAGTDEDRS